MENQSILDALLLGLLEGLTEFIPVSSTGHILLAGHFLGFNSTGKAFEVLIQLGAILAILSVYATRLAQAGRGPADQRQGAPLRARHPGGVPAGGGDRRAGARLHQDGAVRDAHADLHHADPRRRRAALPSTAGR